ncbi:MULTISPECIES: HEAT repeat domain-containing protein [unclassified Algibacter]|uniref:HEAT repeat domain-containing protein n=1 Tax=unclassified Algibacter TaxID=2615009 RepID=UPI00131CCDA8|nr:MULTISPECIES: HEAT repeat domain-containing protein [unclassified Algibacter]MCL5128893.1 HEAT repeat domain-containing protein [Algibacter sp. L4_22]
MLHQITYLLFKLKLIQPKERTIDFWMENEHVEKLEYALKHGNYKTRRLAAEALEQLNNPSTIPALLQCINDKVQNVSVACLNALERMGENDELIKAIVKKRFNWAKKVRDSDAKFKANKNKKHNIYRWERASKKSFDRVKAQLKRPMR